MTDEALLRRFLLTQGDLPHDVAAWAADKLVRSLPPARRKHERDELLREAGDLLDDGPAWSKARALADLVRSVRRAPPVDPDLETARGCVALALLVYPRPLGVAQIYRILVGPRSRLHRDVEMQEAPVARSAHDAIRRGHAVLFAVGARAGSRACG